MKKYSLLTALLFLSAPYAAAQGGDASILWNTTLSSPIAVFDQMDTKGVTQVAGASIGVSEGITNNVTLKMSGQSGNINMIKLENNATLKNLQGTAPVPQWKTPKIIVAGDAQITGKNLVADQFIFDSTDTTNNAKLDANLVHVRDGMTVSDADVNNSLVWGNTSFSGGAPAKDQNKSAIWGTITAGEDGKTSYKNVLYIGAKTAPSPAKYALVDLAQVAIQLNASKCAHRDILSVSHWNPNGIYAEAKNQSSSIYCNYKPGNESDPYCTTYAGDIGLGGNVCYGKSLSSAKLAYLVKAALNRAAQIADTGSSTWSGGNICNHHFKYDLGINSSIGLISHDMSGGTCQTKGAYYYQVEGLSDAVLSGQQKQCLRRSWWDKTFMPEVTCGLQVKVTCKLYQCQ